MDIPVPTTAPWRDPAGRFELTDDLLGEGGYGAVYVAIDHSCQPPARVAAKVLDLTSLRPDQVAREINAYRRLQSTSAEPTCEYVLRLLADAADEERAHYLFFPLCVGGDVLDYSVSSGGLGEPHARPMFEQMVRAVAHLHKLGVAHRDIKLENFFLTAEGDVQLGDMGLATLSAAGGSTSGALMCHDWAGSESYAAPEVWAVESGAAARSSGYDAYPADVWSLGVCLFTMLTNMMPLDTAVPQVDWRYDLLVQCERSGVSYARQLHEEYGRPCTLSPLALSFLSSMLATSPALRPTAESLLGSPSWLVQGPPRSAAAAGSSAPTGDDALRIPSGPPAVPMDTDPSYGWTADELHAKLGPEADARSRSWHTDGFVERDDCAEPAFEVMWRGSATSAERAAPLPPKRQKAREGMRAR